MNEFSTEFVRRSAQFACYLNLMVSRSQQISQHCFLIIQEWRDDESSGRKRRVAAKKQPAEVTARGNSDQNSASENTSEQNTSEALKNRFVQFAFWDRFVVCDVPCNTVTRFEGRRIIRDLPGFGYIRERPDYPYYRSDIPRWDPLQKQYLLDDMETAASDAAHIFFNVWMFPVDSRLFVTSGAFEGRHDWESCVPLN